MTTHTLGTMFQFMLIAALLLNLYTFLVRTKRNALPELDKYLYGISLGGLFLALFLTYFDLSFTRFFAVVGTLAALLVIIRNSQSITALKDSLPPRERTNLLRLYLGAIGIAGILGGFFGYSTYVA